MSRPGTGGRHYHPLAAVQVFRRYLVLALLPLFSALLQWDLAALYRALRQNAVLLAALAVFSLVQTLASVTPADGGRVLRHDGLRVDVG